MTTEFVPQIESTKLALCDMKTLYLRNVPDEVIERLEVLAKREGMSVSAFAVQELTESSRRANNAALLASLPSLDITAEEAVAAIEAGRRAR